MKSTLSAHDVTRLDYSSPIGLLRLSIQDGVITEIDFAGRRRGREPDQAEKRQNRALLQQLDDYFAGRLAVFNLRIQPAGTAYQQKVWQCLRNIPRGEVRSYGEVASELGSSARAVGNACRANPIPLIIPCHRVVSRQGIGGFAGQTAGEKLRIKAWLLQHESVPMALWRSERKSAGNPAGRKAE